MDLISGGRPAALLLLQYRCCAGEPDAVHRAGRSSCDDHLPPEPEPKSLPPNFPQGPRGGARSIEVILGDAPLPHRGVYRFLLPRVPGSKSETRKAWTPATAA
jgi:hypothetical protein